MDAQYRCMDSSCSSKEEIVILFHDPLSGFDLKYSAKGSFTPGKGCSCFFFFRGISVVNQNAKLAILCYLSSSTPPCLYLPEER
jgi:hypothetical protein